MSYLLHLRRNAADYHFAIFKLFFRYCGGVVGVFAWEFDLQLPLQSVQSVPIPTMILASSNLS
jgi:hypothetical protein